MNKFSFYMLLLCLISSIANSHTGSVACQLSADGKKIKSSTKPKEQKTKR